MYSAVLPHGDLAYDPSLIDYKNNSLLINMAAKQIGQTIDQLQPDLIFLSTPHGIEVDIDFAFYTNSEASGFADLGQDLHSNFTPYQVKLDIKLDKNCTIDLVTELKNMGQKVTSILSFADNYPIQLGWGEIIPLSFLNQTIQKNSRVIILSQPFRRYTDSKKMIPELQNLGKILFDKLDSLKENVAIIISSDLAHTHLNNGPYGYSPAAEPFDQAIGNWAMTQNSKYLLEDAAELVDQALSCGFTGLVMLDGILKQSEWNSHVFANFHPSYYGMMVAEFYRLEQ